MTGPSDVERCLDMSEAMGLGAGERLYVATIPVAPWSKSRPRFTRKGFAYHDPRDADAEVRTGTYLRKVVREPFGGNVGIGCLFYRPNRQRIDTDNLIKHVCDAANGVLWADDSQCTAVMGCLELDPQNPRTVIVIGQHISTLTRGTDAHVPCQICGGPIYLERCGGKVPKTCSPECRTKRPGAPGSLGKLVECGQCGRPFKRTTAAQKLCSEECRRNFLRAQLATPNSKCRVCGKQLAHKRGGRCRDCWRCAVTIVEVAR